MGMNTEGGYRKALFIQDLVDGLPDNAFAAQPPMRDFYRLRENGSAYGAYDAERQDADFEVYYGGTARSDREVIADGLRSLHLTGQAIEAVLRQAQIK